MRQEEKLRLMAPYLGAISHEFLAPVVVRHYRILERAGQIPPPPMELQGRTIGVRFVSPLARMQKIADANAAIRAHEALSIAAQTTPGVLDRISADDYAEVVVEGFGPSRILNSRQEAEEIRAQREQQAQIAQMAEMAPGAAKAVKDLTDAQRVADA